MMLFLHKEIDEIENGLHYTVQAEFWTYLFRLAQQFNVQIFATTHSIEMIRAFAAVAQKEDFQSLAAYFELSKHLKTQEILASKHEIDTLQCELERSLTIRGEL